MQEQERQLIELNLEITRQLSKRKPNQALIICLRQTRDNILAVYVAGGGTGWFGNA